MLIALMLVLLFYAGVFVLIAYLVAKFVEQNPVTPADDYSFEYDEYYSVDDSYYNDL